MKVIYLLLLILAPLAHSADPLCANALVKRGAQCRSLEVEFAVSGCKEAERPVLYLVCQAKVGHAIGRTSRSTYHVALRELALGVWVPVGEVRRHGADWKLPSAAALTPALPPVIESAGDTRAFELGGQARVRYLHEELLGNERNRDYALLRMRPDFYFRASPELNIFFQPQLATVMGATPNARSTNGFSDPSLTAHQAFVDWKFHTGFQAILGRQVFTYGDETLVGASEWENTGRSFDAFRFRWSFNRGWLDGFWAIVEERTISAPAKPDRSFAGIYSSVPVPGLIESVEPYFFWLNDSESGSESLFTEGLRIETSFHPWDFRGEITSQHGYSSGQQAWAELGIKIAPNPIRIALRPFWMSKDFNPLFASRYLQPGKAGFLGLRNLCGAGFLTSFKATDSWGMSLEAFHFLRTDVDGPVFRLDGKTPISASIGESQSLGTELDLVSRWELAKQVDFSIGAYLFFSHTSLGNELPSKLGRVEATLELGF